MPTLIAAGRRPPSTSARSRSILALMLGLTILAPAPLLCGEEPRLDLYGDPLPPGVVARLGTVRLCHGRQNKVAAFAPHGDELCTSSSEGRLLFWDVHSGRIVAEYSTGAFSPRAFAWSPDGSRLAVLGFGRLPPERASHWNVQIIDRATVELVAALTWPQHGGNGGAVAFLPDGETIVVGDTDGTIQLLNTVAGEELLKWQVFQDSIEGLAVSPDGGTIAAVASNAPLALFHWREDVEPRTLIVGERGAVDVAFSPDGATVAVAPEHADGASLFDVRSGVRLAVLPKRQERHGPDSVAWSPDGRWLAVGSALARSVMLFDTATRREVRRMSVGQRGAASLSFSADSSLLAAVGNASPVRVWRVATGERLGEEFVGHDDELTARLVWSADGTRIATGDWNGTARVWDAASGRPETVVRHEQAIGGVAISPDRRLLATSSFDGTLRFWRVPDGTEMFCVAGHGLWGTFQRELRFTRDGAQCASWGGDMFLRLWNVANGKALAEHDLRPAGVSIRAFEPGSEESREAIVDAPTFAADGRSFGLLFRQRAYVYDVSSGRETRQIELPPGEARELVFAAEGRRLVTLQSAPPEIVGQWPNGQPKYEQVDRDIVRTWSLETGELVGELAMAESFGTLAHTCDLVAVSRANDGPMISFLDLASGVEVHRIEGGPQVSSLVFSPDDSRLAADLATGEVLVWDVEEAVENHKRTASPPAGRVEE